MSERNDSKHQKQLKAWRQLHSIWSLEMDNKLKINKGSFFQDSKKQQQTASIEVKLDQIDEFIEDLNKKVVLSKLKVKFISQQNQIHSCCENQQVIHSKAANKTQSDMEKQALIERIRQLQNQLSLKDQTIDSLKKTIQKLEIKIEQSTQTRAKSEKHKVFTQYQIDAIKVNNQPIKKTLSTKVLQINTDQINLQFSPLSFKENQQAYQPNSSINPQLPYDDPVFKIPCMSPTMLQMKCIEKMDNERRKKIRQLRKDPTGLKFIANQVQNIAAGVGSPLNQQMLQNVQNPMKNKFIRKPMSRIFNSIYPTPKMIQTQQQSNNNIEYSSDSFYSSQVNEKTKQPQKLNLPYFMSLKKMSKQSQK